MNNQTPSEPGALTPALLGAVGAAALAGLLFGFDTAVIAGVTGDIRRVFDLSPAMLGVTVSSALWGTLLGAAFAGKPGDRFGSRDGLRAMAILYLISSLGCALAWSWPSLLIARFIGGLAIGGSSVLAPIYVAEIAPTRRRGALVGLFQLNIVAGILLAYLSNALIAAADLGASAWRWKLAVTIAPAALLWLVLGPAPHSPRWLAARGRTAEAQEAARRLGGGAPSAGTLIPGDGVRLSWRRHRTPILLAVGLAMFNQFTGINALLYYLNDIFADAGFAAASADLQAVIIGLTNLIFTLLAMAVIDRFGRKHLLLVGSVGMAACLGLASYVLSTGQHAGWLLYGLIGFIAAFAFSQGAVIWVYLSEIFPTAVRARGQALGSSVHWLANAVISGLFPIIAARAPGAPFAIFAGLMLVQFVVVALLYPETKGVDLETLAARLAPSDVEKQN
ncbi:sugar porter family MFS transporter [Caulobacter segnis]|uniref:MFS transporter n=1 Tax=Caulobacter segnis TaxID=88688 RepID=A0A2W5V8B9_9CAUL|nr:sugar porter family MFS transporter [Caulobacter segnis]PZR35462.1 MAG: MFS transporter [Caulobacter segnis]